MRVVVQHTDPEHPNAGVAAYRFGRVLDQNDPLTGEPIAADRLMVALLEQARKDFPEADGYRVFPQRILCDACSLAPHRDGECAASDASWHEIDEQALRARADGELVDVNLISPDATPVEVAVEQPTEEVV